MSFPDVPIGSFYTVNNSCQVIVGNPPIDQGLKSLQFHGTRVIRISQRSQPQQVIVKSGISINRERSSLFITHSLTLSCSAQLRKNKLLGLKRKRLLLSRYHLTVFAALLLVLILSLRKLQGFLHYGFPEENLCVHYLMCLIDVLVILSVKILS